MTGDSFATEISILTNPDLKTVSKRLVGFSVGKTNSKNQPEVLTNQRLRTIQELVSLEVKEDHVQFVEHYEKTLGAFHFGGRIMIIETQAALRLFNKYFQN